MSEQTALQLGTEVAKNRLAQEFQRYDALDTKASLVIGFIGVLVGFVFDATIGLISSDAQTSSILPLPLTVVLIFGAAFIALFISGGSALYSLSLREYYLGLGYDILKVLAYKHKDQTESVEQDIFDSFAGAFHQANLQNSKKAFAVQISLLSLTAGILLVFIALIALAIEKRVIVIS